MRHQQQMGGSQDVFGCMPWSVFEACFTSGGHACLVMWVRPKRLGPGVVGQLLAADHVWKQHQGHTPGQLLMSHHPGWSIQGVGLQAKQQQRCMCWQDYEAYSIAASGPAVHRQL